MKLLRAALAALVLLTVGVAGAGATTLFQDNFDSDTVGALPSGWTAAVGAWSVGTDAPTSGANDLRSTSASQFDAVLRTGTPDVSTDLQQYSYRYKSGSQSLGAIWRSDTAFNNAYICNFDLGTGTALFFKRTGGSYGNSTKVTFTSPTFAANDIVIVERRTPSAGTHEFRVWNGTSGSRPSSPTATFTDSTYNSGYSGIFLDSASSPGFDDYYYTDGSLVPVASPVVIAPNNAAIVYSPGNWNITATAATTINAGAYLDTLTSSASVTLNFNVANNSTPTSEIQYRIDGYETQSPWTTAPVAATINVAMPSDTSAAPYHLVEVRVKSTSETINRWNSPSNTAVVFTGLTLASGAAVVTPGVAPAGKVLFFGDSITEGVRTVNSTASNDTDRNSVAMGWAYRQRDLLGAEVGLIGFGGSGLTVTGSGNVPVLSTSYSMMYGGQARTPDTSVALIVDNVGTNDQSASAASVTSAMVTVLNGQLSAYPSTPIAVMRPFGGYQASALQAAIAQCSAPARVTWIDTTGFLNTAYGIDSLGLHPTGANDLAVIAPKVAAKLRPLLVPANSNTPAFPLRRFN